MDNDKKEVKVLFVCMGNICRSPSGEAVMNSYIRKSGLFDKIKCDSAGTIAYHAGEPADSRMQRHAKKRSYNLTGISRQVIKSDFDEFDYIIAMDNDNYTDLEKLFMPSAMYSGKLKRMTDYCTKPNPGYVPDPYYGGSDGFEQVLDILEDACEGLLKHICNEHNI